MSSPEIDREGNVPPERHPLEGSPQKVPFIRPLPSTVVDATRKPGLEVGPGLESVGFIKFNPVDQFDDIDVEGALEGLRKEFAGLPPDPYGEGKHRYRRYGRALLFPEERERSLEWRPTSRDERGAEIVEYFQDQYNPDFVGARRRLPALTDEAKSNPLLTRLIWYDWGLTSWDNKGSDLPFLVGVHFIKLSVAQDGQSAVSSPNSLHQDGETFTFAHLVTKKNVHGGANVIASPKYSGLHPDDLRERVLMARFELSAPMDSYGVYDEKVSHHVDPVRRGPLPEPAERGIILVDFAPIAPHMAKPA